MDFYQLIFYKSELLFHSLLLGNNFLPVNNCSEQQSSGLREKKKVELNASYTIKDSHKNVKKILKSHHFENSL